ncbi:PH domain-containing protein [Leucobacter allii]|uniref:PH domain-containing protein n=1 Tax=Leucobacter allii TaxID=2932247 RepID=A0ABY4FHV9_9MICO|nr:PH domain-containing protein [Leucobacter allii]UOQ56272.1 PH domain-containing protein [Leucobacter allii]
MTEAGGPAISDAALPGNADAEGWRRLHPLSPLLRGGVVLIVVAGIVFANFRDHFVNLFFSDRFTGGGVEVDMNGEGDIVDLYEYLAAEGLLLLVLGGVLLVLVLIIVFSWVAWRFATYRIGEDDVEARRGVLFRTHRRAPLERIQSVNLQRSLLARAFGLTKIEIVTAGQGGKVELAYLAHGDAKTVREQIVRRAAVKRGEGSAPGGFPGPSETPETAAAPRAAASGDNAFASGDYAVASGDRAAEASGATPDPATTAVGIDGRPYAPAGDRLSARAQDFADFDIDPAALAADALVKVPLGRLIGSIALGWEAVVVMLIAVLVVAGGAVFEPALILTVIPLGIVMVGIVFSQFNKGFNFALSRGRDAIRTGSGLTSTMTESIPFGRIHAVEARQPLLWRPLGWWRARITTAGHSVAQGGQNATQNVVLPVGTEADVLRVIEALLPGVGDDERGIAALRDALSGAGTGYLGAGPRAGWVLWFGRRRAGVAVAETGSADATLRIRRGALTRSLSIMPLVRAQSVQLRRPLVHRWLGLASLQAHTVLGPVRMEMRGIALEPARELFDVLEADVLRIQNAEARELSDAQDRLPERPPARVAEAGTGIPAPRAAGAEPHGPARLADVPGDVPGDAPGNVPGAP